MAGMPGTVTIKSAGHYGAYTSKVHGRTRLPYAATHHKPAKLHGRQRHGDRLPAAAMKDPWHGKGAMKNH
jgi:hypothetical protein